MQPRALARSVIAPTTAFTGPCFISPDPLESCASSTTSPTASRGVARIESRARSSGWHPAGGSRGPRTSGWRIRPARPRGARRGLRRTSRRGCEGFVYRFFDADQLAGLLAGAGRALSRHGSLEGAWPPERAEVGTRCSPVLRASGRLARGRGRRPARPLDPAPEARTAAARASGCCSSLRWMVRSDEIDPGGWER